MDYKMDYKMLTISCCGSTHKAYVTSQWWVSRTGYTPFQLLGTCPICKHVHVRYASGFERKWPASDVIPWTGPLPGDCKTETKETKGTDMKTLYEIKNGENVVFAHKIAVNSAGQWIMEERGTAQIHVVDKADCTEVLPFTVAIKFMRGQGKRYHFFATVGELTVGDLIMTDDCKLAEVVKIDTKSRHATKWLTGFVLQGRKLTVDSSEDDIDSSEADKDDDLF